MTSCSRHGATRNQWEATESATRVVPEVDSSPPSTKSHEGEGEIPSPKICISRNVEAQYLFHKKG